MHTRTHKREWGELDDGNGASGTIIKYTYIRVHTSGNGANGIESWEKRGDIAKLRCINKLRPPAELAPQAAPAACKAASIYIYIYIYCTTI